MSAADRGTRPKDLGGGAVRAGSGGGGVGPLDMRKAVGAPILLIEGIGPV
ncbi:hypothetical protein [Streptomyces vinaceus]